MLFGEMALVVQHQWLKVVITYRQSGERIFSAEKLNEKAVLFYYVAFSFSPMINYLVLFLILTS
jgi:hypothetical protein